MPVDTAKEKRTSNLNRFFLGDESYSNYSDIFHRLCQFVFESKKTYFNLIEFYRINNQTFQFTIEKTSLKLTLEQKDDKNYVFADFDETENNAIINNFVLFLVNHFKLVKEWELILPNINKIDFPDIRSIVTAIDITSLQYESEIPIKKDKFINLSYSIPTYIIAAIIRTLCSLSNSTVISIGIILNNSIYPFYYNLSADTCLDELLSNCFNIQQSLLYKKNDIFEIDELKRYFGLASDSEICQILIDLPLNGEDKDYIKYKIFIPDSNYNEYVYNVIFKSINAVFNQLLVGFSSDKISSISIIDKEESNLLDKFNNTDKNYLYQTLLHQFEEVARNSKDSDIAIIHEGELITKYTYRDLLEKVNAISFILINHESYKRQSVIAVYLKPGPNLITTFLTILKMGCIYMPIDPNAPQERIKEQLNDGKPTILIVDENSANLNTMDLNNDIAIIKINKEFLLKNIPEVDTQVSIADAAYLLYTSGSTGKPKGVIIGHKQIANSVLDLIERLSITKSDKWLALANCTFDLSILEWITPLVIGATCVSTDREYATNGEKIQQLLKKNAITILEATPVTWQLLLKTGWVNDKNMKKLCGGEALSIELAKKIAPVFHVYGTTETTTWSTCKYICDTDSTISIGKPIANTQIYILDQFRQRLPRGVIGELYIGGVGLGYYLDPNLNKEKFINNPLPNCFNDIVYKTGDYAYWDINSESNIVFIGRKDNQLKIRGQRIDVGQIEEHIEKCSMVERCVIIPNKNEEGDIYLAAFVAQKYDSVFDESVVKRHCLNYLMPYMIPSIFISLEKMPISSNGKIDRKVLGSYEISKPQLINECEKSISKIKNIWAKVLYKDSNLILDDKDFFFDYGGNSISAARVVNMLNQEFQLMLPTRAIYDNPTINLLDTLVTKSLKIIPSSQMPPLTPYNGKEHIPLSAPQRDIWFIMYRLARNLPIYNNYLVVKMEGEVDIKKLFEALTLIFIQQEILRSNFLGDNLNDAYLKIKPIDKIDFDKIVKYIELGENSSFIDYIDAEIGKFVNTPFELDKEVPFRARVYKCIDNVIYFVVSTSHIVFDGISEQVFCRLLQEKYNAGDTQEQVVLPQISYADYCIWQKKLLNNDEIMRDKFNYWERVLANFEPLIMPYKKSVAELRTYKAKHCVIFLSEKITDNFKRMAVDNKISLFSIMLAAFKVLLFRYTEQSDISISISTDGRYHALITEIIGHFVNLVIVRDVIKGDYSFINYAMQVHNTVLSAIDNQHVPYSHIIQNILVPQKVSPPDIVFVHIPQVSIALNGVKAEVQLPFNSYAKYSLSIYVQEKGKGIYISFEYSIEQYESKLIQKMTENYYALLVDIMNNPFKNIYKLNTLSNKDIIFLKSCSIGEQVDLKVNNILKLVDNVISLNADSPALVYENEIITYKKFSEMQNLLADILCEHNIRVRAIGEEDVVAFYMHRNPLIEIARWGILKAGAAFLPVDITYPAERVAFMLKESNVKLILTLKSYDTLLRSLFEQNQINCKIICLDTINWNLILHNSVLNLVTLEHLAYNIYTSGSTGMPKGVNISHRAFLNLAFDIKKRFKIGPGDRVLAFSSYGFDASVFESVMSMVTGAELVIPPKEYILLAGENLKEVIDKYKVTFALLPPSVANTIAHYELPSLKVIQLGGEACSMELVNKLSVNNRQVGNLYGPTEGAVYITASECKPNEIPRIGRPIINSKVMVLDKNYQLLPEGVPGQVFIAGASLARGYNNETLNKESFIQIQDPFEYGKQIIVYKTGDLAAWMSDGQLLYHKRIDSQVKINAVRIELSEIESAIRDAEAIVSDVVILFKNKKINAYIVLTEKGLQLDYFRLEARLHSRLDKRLPRYMLLSINFIFIESVPITTNGKIDRSALERLVPIKISTDNARTLSGFEKVIASIWSEVLNINKDYNINSNDSFFRLGGASLDTVEVIQKVKKSLKISNIDEQDLLEHPRLQDFANLIALKKSLSVMNEKRAINIFIQKDIEKHTFTTTINEKNDEYKPPI